MTTTQPTQSGPLAIACPVCTATAEEDCHKPQGALRPHKARVEAAAKIDTLLQVLDDRFLGRNWVFSGAARFADNYTKDPREAAAAVLAYFAPSGDESRDAYRRRNGYTITTDTGIIRHIILRAAS